jgi:para-nitrobenzyl esterase
VLDLSRLHARYALAIQAKGETVTALNGSLWVKSMLSFRRLNRMGSVGAIALMAGLIAFSGPVAAQVAAQPVAAVPPAPVTVVRSTELGPVRGVVKGPSVNFLAIPYAAPPVGNLRWKPPQPASVWTTERVAEAFGPICPQAGGFPSMPRSEDCLTLNISVPTGTTPDAKLPVLFRIHGGGYVGGSGPLEHSAEVWNPEGVILVTFNYRLGPLGVLAHPLLMAEAAGKPQPVNFALLDMKAALEWTHRNIAAFGGDPAKLTLTGVSAGGEGVQLLQLMPGTQGLFARAISSSGYTAWPLPRATPTVDGGPAEAVRLGSETILRANGGKEPTSLDEMRALEVKALLASIRGFQLPVIDGVTLLDDPVTLFSKGADHPVPVMTGGNSYEGSVFPSSGVTPEAVVALLGDQAPAMRALYADDFAVSEARGISRMFGDMRYVFSSAAMVSSVSRRQPAYLYYVTYVEPDRRATQPGTFHAGETGILQWGGRTPASLAVGNPGKAMRGYWLNFIKRGDPNGGTEPLWPKSTPDQPHWMVFGETVAVKDDVLADKMALLRKIHSARFSVPSQAPVATKSR